MPSTFSDLKIELMATGEKNTTWGDISNANWDAMEEAVSGSADVVFASADVTLTLVDTNSAQIGRNLRLNLVGTTGGAARNLILGAGMQIEKIYLVRNACADTITVKNTTGTGVTVAAGQSMFVYNDGTNVSSAVSTVQGNFTPNFHVKADAGGALVSSTLVQENATGVGVGGLPNSDRMLTVRKDAAAGTKLSFINDTAAGTGFVQTSLTNTAGGDSLTFYKFGPSFASSGFQLANSSLIEANGVEGLTVLGTSGPIKFATLATERMRVAAGGYIQIGSGAITNTTGATCKVNIASANATNALPTLGTINADTALFISTATNTFGLNILPNATGLVSLQSQYAQGTVVPLALALNPMGGSVGIGTAAPSTPLEVGGTMRVSAQPVTNSAILEITANPVSTNGVSLSSTYYGSSGYGPMAFWTAGAKRMDIRADGIVDVYSEALFREKMTLNGTGVTLIPNNEVVTANGTTSPLYGFRGTTPDDSGGNVAMFISAWDGVRMFSGGAEKFRIQGSVATFRCNSLILGVAPTDGGLSMIKGGASNTGYLAFHRETGLRLGYIGNMSNAAGSSTLYVNENGGGHSFYGSPHPSASGAWNIGAVALPWGTVYATNNVIQPSDEREKDWIGAPDEAAIRAAGRIIDELGFYTWKTGSDTDIHLGVRAQQVLRILMEEGLEDMQDIDLEPGVFIANPPALRYAIIQFGTWEESEGHTPPPPQPAEEEPEPHTPEPVIVPAGNRFCLNYAELSLFIACAQHARMNSLEARLTAAGI